MGTDTLLKRKEVSDYLEISMDTLRNWERNGLLQVKRKKNGYRAYTSDSFLQVYGRTYTIEKTDYSC